MKNSYTRYIIFNETKQNNPTNMKLPEIDASFSDMDNDEVEVIKDDPEGTALATEAE